MMLESHTNTFISYAVMTHKIFQGDLEITNDYGKLNFIVIIIYFHWIYFSDRPCVKVDFLISVPKSFLDKSQQVIQVK